jgi:sortase A
MSARQSIVSRIALWLGYGLILAGLVLLGASLDRLWLSDIRARQAASDDRADVYANWGLATFDATTKPRFLVPLFDPQSVVDTPESIMATPAVSSTVPTSSVAPATTLDPIATQQFDITTTENGAFALLYVPRMRDTAWGTPILSGVADEQLNRGIGHFPANSLPGTSGNFALAGHRMTYGKPFTDIDKLQVGDEVIVETRDKYFVYTLVDDRIVAPTDVWVLDDKPIPGVDASIKGVITLVTCEPKWSTKNRWVWWGELTTVLDRSNPPAALS